jgi:hypothetical protein
MLGELVLPEGWTKENDFFEGMWQDVFKDADGTWQSAHPGGKPGGSIALADAIRDMRAMTKLDARDNDIDDEGKRALQQAAGSRWGA